MNLGGLIRLCVFPFLNSCAPAGIALAAAAHLPLGLIPTFEIKRNCHSVWSVARVFNLCKLKIWVLATVLPWSLSNVVIT
ncbi:MAG: hypothetical protein ACKESB_03900 [Candidatus Hodgkinia cicadicola]